MRDDPKFQFDPMRLLWDGAARKVTNVKDAGGDAARRAKRHAVGRRLTLGEVRMVQAMFGTTTGFGAARVVDRNPERIPFSPGHNRTS